MTTSRQLSLDFAGSGETATTAPFADEVDGIQANENREISVATRERLLERVNRLSAALDRLHDGQYGVCGECAEGISAGRLQAVPEVQTCLRCQEAGSHGEVRATYVTKVQ